MLQKTYFLSQHPDYVAIQTQRSTLTIVNSEGREQQQLCTDARRCETPSHVQIYIVSVHCHC